MSFGKRAVDAVAPKATPAPAPVRLLADEIPTPFTTAQLLRRGLWSGAVGYLAFGVVGAFALVLLAAAMAEPAEHTKAKSAVRARLFDPDSAQFYALRKLQSGWIEGCVNARNRMGGYTGRKGFYYTGYDVQFSSMPDCHQF